MLASQSLRRKLQRFRETAILEGTTAYPLNGLTRPLLTKDGRGVLELLARSAEGCTEVLLLAQGFSVELLCDLVCDGLASAHAERMVAGSKVIEVARMRITEAGRQALTGRGTQ